MTSTSKESVDQGGETPCFAHLREELHFGVEGTALGQLVQDLADTVVIADPAGTIVFWNRAATTLFGWSDEQADRHVVGSDHSRTGS